MEEHFDAEKGTIERGGSRLVFHCHHYNVFLQRSVEDMLGPAAIPLQIDAAAEAARTMLTRAFASGPAGFDERIAEAREAFGALGFGRASTELEPLGGVVRIQPEHYSVGWESKFGKARAPISHFAVGFWRGAVVAAAGHAPERVIAEQVSCSAMGAATNEIRITVR